MKNACTLVAINSTEKLNKTDLDHSHKETCKHSSYTMASKSTTDDQKKKEEKKKIQSNTWMGAIKNTVQWAKQKIEDTRFDDSERAQKELPEKMKSISTPMQPTSSKMQIYTLPLCSTKTDESEMIARYYVKEKVPSRTMGVSERVLMVVGATGAGKSTLINGMANYILGVKWKHNFRFKLITDEGSGSQANSQTKWITAYTFPRRDGSPVHYNLTIIDTPGFGDTEGLRRDKRIAVQIKKLFETSAKDGGMDTIHGIGFVTKAPESRLTPTQRYIFNAILQNFGKDIADNIFLLVTFADGKTPPVLDAIKEANIPVQPTVFKFNNSALYAASENDKQDDDDDEEDFDSMFWKMGMKSFKKFFEAFKKANAKSLQLTRDVLHEREQLEILIQALQEQVRAGMNKMNSLSLEMDILHKYEDAIQENKDFEYTVEEEKMIHVPITGENRWYVTNCLTCNYTCHDNCIYSNDEDKKQCSAMNQSTGHCRVCPKKCHWTQHKNNDFYYKLQTVKVEKTYSKMQEKYRDAQGKFSRSEAVVKGIEQELQDLRKMVFTMIIELHQSIEHLEEIALKPDPLSQVSYIDLLIESEKQQATKGWEKRVEYYQEAREQAVFIANFTGKEATIDPKLEALLDVDSVQLLISAEEKHQKEGWEERIQQYKAIKMRLKKDDDEQNTSTCNVQ